MDEGDTRPGHRVLQFGLFDALQGAFSNSLPAHFFSRLAKFTPSPKVKGNLS